MLKVRKSIDVPPLRWRARLLDRLAKPLMRLCMLLNGTPRESPQETHRWNNRRLAPEEIQALDPAIMCRVKGDAYARPPFWIGPVPSFHLPIFGWQRYVVLRPRYHDYRSGRWYIGWVTGGAAAVSLRPNLSAARCLIGPGDVSFFALDEYGFLLPLEELGTDWLGSPTAFRHLPLR